MFVELFDIVYNINSKKRDIFFDPFNGEFYYDDEFESLPECVKKDVIPLPDNEWRTAAKQFLDLYLHKKYQERFNQSFSLSKIGFNDFWSEMEKYNLIWEWREYYANFLFEKAEKWCLENNIPYTEKKVPRGDFFAT